MVARAHALIGDNAHPAIPFEHAIVGARARAVAAQLALWLTIGSDLFTLSLNVARAVLVREVRAGDEVHLTALRLCDGLATRGAALGALLTVVTAVLFIRWLWIVVRLARELGGGVRWKPRDALWAFVIPFVNLWEPYQLLNDLRRALAPERVPEPLPRLQVDGSLGYREGRLVVPPSRLVLPSSVIGLWWSAYLLAKLPGLVFGLIGSVARLGGGDPAVYLRAQLCALIASDALDAASALLAIQVVRAVAARLAERFRRIRHSPTEALREAGIELGSGSPQVALDAP